MRYDWPLKHIPTHCACGEAFDVKHALSCPFGGFPTIRHNKVRDLLAGLLCEICPNVRTEPQLDSLTGEIFPLATTSTADEARVDIQAGSFWGNSRFETALFDVRVFNPFAESNRSSSSTSSTYRKHERQKRRQYEQRVREVDNSSFCPLVFSSSGGAGPAATVFLKRLAPRLSQVRVIPYSVMMGWLRCHLSFSLLRSSILCIRGACSSRHRLGNFQPVLAVSESCLADY